MALLKSTKCGVKKEEFIIVCVIRAEKVSVGEKITFMHECLLGSLHFHLHKVFQVSANEGSRNRRTGIKAVSLS